MVKFKAFFRRLRLKVFKPRPLGHCRYCGGLTKQYSPFDKTSYRHMSCLEDYIKSFDILREERKKIDLIKTAMLELKEEGKL